jgi:hypothetical protein
MRPIDRPPTACPLDPEHWTRYVSGPNYVPPEKIKDGDPLGGFVSLMQDRFVARVRCEDCETEWEDLW